MNLFVFALKENCRRPLNVILLALLPLTLLAFPATDDYLPIKLSLYGMMNFYSAFLLTRPVVEDRMKGLVVRIAASPVTPLKYLGSHLAAYVVLLTGQNLLFITAVGALHASMRPDLAVLFTLFTLFGAMGLAFSLAWNALFRNFGLSFGVFAGIGSLMCMANGLSMPLSFIPDAILRFSMFLPTYWLAHGLQALLDADAAGVLTAHALLLAYAVLLLLAGSKRRL